MTAPESVVRAVAAHEPRCSNVGGGGHTGTNEPPIYCHPCSEAAQEWVTWTPEHVADAAWVASLEAAAERLEMEGNGEAWARFGAAVLRRSTDGSTQS